MPRTPVLVLIFSLGAACGDDSSEVDAGDAGVDGPSDAADGGFDAGPAELPPRGAAMRIDRREGRIDLRDDEGTLYLRGAWAEVLLDDDTILRTSECEGSWTDAGPMLDAFPESETSRFECSVDGVGLRWDVATDDTRGAAMARIAVTTDGTRVMRFTPLITEGEEGGFFLGPDVDAHRILDDGADVIRDTIAELHYPRERRTVFVNTVPIEHRGNVVANWSHAIADLEGERHWVAGVLEPQTSIVTLGTSLRGEGPFDDTTRRRGFDRFVVDCGLAFEGKVVEDELSSEVIWIDALSDSAQEGLERYAEAAADAMGIETWIDRGLPVPNGWNSWGGGGSAGGFGTDIDEMLMAENLEAMDREFDDFGIDYFQIDDGYQRANGDWVANPARFPEGMAAFADRVRDAGLIPGIWIQPMTVGESSELASNHPDYLADPDNAVLGDALAPGEGQRVLDVSDPDARQWLHDTMRRYRDDWGMGWVKVDFAYQAFPYRMQNNETAVESYRAALRSIREGLGPDVFLMTIGLVGMSYGIADTFRLTLDDGPIWEEDPIDGPLGTPGSLKNTVRTGSRRYFFHGRVWLTHNDLLFHRTAPGVPTVTVPETEAFASFVGLSGSIVKFGEDLRSLTPAQIDQWRRLLPIYPASGRPLDLFTRHYPERWTFAVDGTMAGSDAVWQVVGLMNWGRNLDYSAVDMAAPMADEARELAVELPDGEWIAREFWSGDYLGVVSGTLTQTVAAHSARLVALRPRRDHPQLLGHNRHWTQGGTDLISETWDADARTLTIRLRVDQGAPEAVPFEYEVAVRAPEGFVAMDGTQDGEVVTLRFTPATSGEETIVVRFE